MFITRLNIFENETASSKRRQVHAKWRSDEACRAPRGSRSKAPAILLTPSISVGPVTPFPSAGIRFRGPGMRPRYSNGVSACVTRLPVAEHQDNLIFIGQSCQHSQNSASRDSRIRATRQRLLWLLYARCNDLNDSRKVFVESMVLINCTNYGSNSK